MTRLARCLDQHDPTLVILAMLVCLLGTAASMHLFGRMRSATGRSRIGWLILTAVATGSSVWSTHFVAVLAYRPGSSVILSPALTMLSLVIAIVLAAPGLALAGTGGRTAAAIGGAIVGTAISAMHYAGMAAFRVDGLIQWDIRYVILSLGLASALAAAAFVTAVPQDGRSRTLPGGVLLGLSVASLHFAGMTAMTIVPLDMQRGGLDDLTSSVLAFSTAFATLLVIGCAGASALIDSHTQGEAYRRLRRAALRDGLTDLPNRMSFDDEFGRMLAARARSGGRLAVVMMDLARFKAVNDTYGHQAGDQLLVALAARLASIPQPGAFLARLGGDEFAALVPIGSANDLDLYLQRLGSCFEEPFRFERFAAPCGVSVGVALAPDDGEDADALLANADLAMYRAKANRTGPCFYEARMDDVVRDGRELATELRAAIGSDQFKLYYQVQASLATGTITGYEALLRWDHPQRGAIPPAVFIPLAETVGEIERLGRWALRQACLDAVAWPQPYSLSVNLSPLQLADPTLVDWVGTVLRESGLPAGRLELELTESAIIRDRIHALATLNALKAIGIGISLDDFGVGYSSLDVLRCFPFDRIKLDASFVAAIERDDRAVAILSSIAALGHRLGMRVLAEGVETGSQLAIAAREGCDSAQGFLLGCPARMPVDAEALHGLMATVTPAVAVPLVA